METAGDICVIDNALWVVYENSETCSQVFQIYGLECDFLQTTKRRGHVLGYAFIFINHSELGS